MKKIIALILSLCCVLSFAACDASKPAPTVTEPISTSAPETEQSTETDTQPEAEVVETEPTTEEPVTEELAAHIVPLPSTINLSALEDSTLSVSLIEGAVRKDDAGAVVMDVTIFDYDVYDMIDIAALKEGDTIVRGQETVTVSSIERTEDGAVLINGGLDAGGFNLHTDDSTIYYEMGYSDTKSYYALGTITILVSPDFVYTDESNLDNGPATYNADDFLNNAEGIDYLFNEHNTTIQIQNGMVVAMTRIYTP